MNQKLAIIILLIIIALTSFGFWFLIQSRKGVKEVPAVTKQVPAPSIYVKDGKIIDPVARKAELEVIIEKSIEEKKLARLKYPKNVIYTEEDLKYIDRNKSYIINSLAQKGIISVEDKNLLK